MAILARFERAAFRLGDEYGADPMSSSKVVYAPQTIDLQGFPKNTRTPFSLQNPSKSAKIHPRVRQILAAANFGGNSFLQ